MIPLYLTLSGFLSYRDPVELDFTGFELACISGPNGAGKSSLLDAITWALFGQARKRDDALINAHSQAAEVGLIFAYEGNLYRVQRSKPREKTAMLEFHILQGGEELAGGQVVGKQVSGNQAGGSQAAGNQFVPAGVGYTNSNKTYAPNINLQALISNSNGWKPLTERTLRETELRIQQTLRLDYETFVNASFFLQGKADQFTQQRPGDRKRILSSILGLEVWELYRRRTAERRKTVEADIAGVEGRLHEINSELGEENARKTRLKELESDLKRLARARATQESALERLRADAARLAEQEKLIEALGRQLQAASRRLSELQASLAARQEEKNVHARVLERAAAVEAAYAAWEQARAELERWEEIAGRVREHERRLQEPLDALKEARARLEQERQTLENQQKAWQEQAALLPALQAQQIQAQQSLAKAETALAQRSQLDAELQAARQRQAEARAENPRLKAEMDELKERINQLAGVEGADCPLCGQPLSTEERQKLIEELNAQGKEKGDKFRANQALVRESDQLVRGLEGQIAALAQAEADLRAHTSSFTQINARLEQIEQHKASWESGGLPRLNEINLSLQQEIYAPEARIKLAEIGAELKAFGYDAGAHEAARRAEAQGRSAEAELRALERARAALAPLEREIAGLQAQDAGLRVEVDRQQQEYDQAAAHLAAAQAQAPDLFAAERELFDLQERENQVRLEVGAARQKVLVLEDLKARCQALESRRADLALQAGQYRQLERAFGKDGVPALLIEQALPQIEVKANEILERLSQGAMAVRFVTQSAYKDKRRDDLRETLDIVISDGAGTRDYEMFSGGEAFRVNFAIRLALSEVLAQRAGARLQTLVIDEGFGSQDTQGRQRLVEAINLVRQDFAKVLIISHIDELKDAFPTRIEVEKTGRGSIIKVI